MICELSHNYLIVVTEPKKLGMEGTWNREGQGGHTINCCDRMLCAKQVMIGEVLSL